MTAANFTLIPQLVIPEEPNFPTIITQSEGMKKQYQSLSNTPNLRYKLIFKNISDVNFWTIYNHYYSCYGPYDSFSWTSVPDWIDLFTNDTYTSLTNVGSNLIVNPGFDSDTSSWTATYCTIASVAGGQAGNGLEITRVSGDQQFAYQEATLVIGKIYKVTTYVKSGTSGNEAFWLSVYNNSISERTYEAGTSSASWVQYTIVFRAVNTAATLHLRKYTATAGTMLFDTVTFYNVTQNMTGRWVKDSFKFSPNPKSWDAEIVFEKAI